MLFQELSKFIEIKTEHIEWGEKQSYLEMKMIECDK